MEKTVAIRRIEEKTGVCLIPASLQIQIFNFMSRKLSRKETQKNGAKLIAKTNKQTNIIPKKQSCNL